MTHLDECTISVVGNSLWGLLVAQWLEPLECSSSQSQWVWFSIFCLFLFCFLWTRNTKCAISDKQCNYSFSL